jgi:phosphinothricin acetyltransferase
MNMSTTVLIRPATEIDLPAIDAIYNHYVLHSTCTYQEEPTTADERRQWFASLGPTHPVTVATVDGDVVGWAALAPFKQRSAYRWTVENSVYVHPTQLRRGIGRSLLHDQINRATSLGLHSIIAVIDAEQSGSIALHAQCGFKHAGQLREAGFKFGRWLDVVYLQRTL